MRAHVIENGKITNTIEVDSLDIDLGLVLVDADLGGQIGDDWVDGEVVPSPPPAPEVPQAVTNGQAREALLNAGLYDQVEPVIAAIADADIRQRAEIAWEYRPTVERDSPLVAMIAQALNMDDAALDQLFIEAAQL